MNNYRLLFALAAFYNLAFAVWSGLLPEIFFDRLFGIKPPEFIYISWPPVAAVVGLFGLLYAFAAWKPDWADLPIGIGLASKIAGPLVWLVAVSSGPWPLKTFPLVLIGDMLWWFPLLSFLVRRSPLRVWFIVGASVALHLAACIGLLLILPATELGASLKEKQTWVQEHRAIYLAVWMTWTASSLSLLAVIGQWTARLHRWPEARLVGLAACAIVGCGVLLDLCGETSLIAWAARPDVSVAGFAAALQWYQRLSPAAANGLYCVGGSLLSLASWRTGLLRGAAARLGFTMWNVGLLLTAATLFHSTLGMVVTGAAVMALYLVWAPLLAVRLIDADMAAATPKEEA